MRSAGWGRPAMVAEARRPGVGDEGAVGRRLGKVEAALPGSRHLFPAAAWAANLAVRSMKMDDVRALLTSIYP